MKKFLSILMTMCMVFVICTTAFASSDSVVKTSQQKEVVEAANYAYMNIETAPDVLHKKILDSRKIIIYTKSWVADDLTAYTFNKNTGEKISEIPKFHEVFPADWDLPTLDSNTIGTSSVNAVTSDYSTSFYHTYAYLSHPTSELTSPFTSIYGTGGTFFTVPDSIPGTTYNLGYTCNGVSVCSGLYLDSATGLACETNFDSTYGIRASTYDTTGDAYFTGDYLN